MYGLGVEALMEKPLTRKDFIRAMEQCLMEREELWRTSPATPMAQRAALEIESLGEAMRLSEFQLGRGGCCFPSWHGAEETHPLEAEKTIDLSIRFAQEGLSLSVQGKVRWVDQETAQAGMSFDYLGKECRAWVIGAMRNGAYRSFIPPGRARSSAVKVGGGAELVPAGVT